MAKNLKKKIELSNLLEQVETNFDSKEIISKLDKLHSKSKAHVIGITGAPGVGKSSLIDKLVKHIKRRIELSESLLLILHQKGQAELYWETELD